MALRRITLRDFVIVDELELDLADGFTVLTGETGAGKSILIDALQLVLGARAQADVVREGATRADVCVEFDTLEVLHPWLEQAGVPTSEDGALLLRRTVDTQGKSRAWVNAVPVTVTQLRELGVFLLDIHGQHAWQSLSSAHSVRLLLDRYAQIDLTAVQQSWQQWRSALQALQQARAAQDTLQSERERLQWQIQELGKLAPTAGEWDELNTHHARQSHAQSLLDAAQKALDALQGEEAEEASALASLLIAQSALQAQEHLEPEFKPMTDVLASCVAQLEDVAHTLGGYLRHTEVDPQQLQELDERMSLWVSLARRYKRSPAELAPLWQEWKDTLQSLEAAADLEQLERQETQTQRTFMEHARKLSLARQAAAPRLAHAISAAMQELGMKGGRFEVQLTPLQQACAHGLEDVEFLVSAHEGSSLKPVGKVASGGELSRIALAIAVTTSELGQVPTLIFDEVDSGVGGAVAHTVGRLMRELGSHRQVLAVTHLAQVAACAHQHLQVSKHTQAGMTRSRVATIQADARVQEVARMLGGHAQSQASLAHARELLSLV